MFQITFAWWHPMLFGVVMGLTRCLYDEVSAALRAWSVRRARRAAIDNERSRTHGA